MRIVLATALAVLIATPLNLAIEAFTRQAFAVPPEFGPFQGSVGPYTVGGVLLAAAAFVVLRRFGVTTRTYVWISIAALVLSWIPDVMLLVAQDPGATAPAVGSLMLMHAVTAVIVVGLLTRRGVSGTATP